MVENTEPVVAALSADSRADAQNDATTCAIRLRERAVAEPAPEHFVTPTVTDEQLQEIHRGLRKCASPPTPVMLVVGGNVKAVH